MTTTYRTKAGLPSERQVPADACYGVHTLRAWENFQISGTPRRWTKRCPEALIQLRADNLGGKP